MTRLRVTTGPAPEVEVFLFPRSSPGYKDDVGAQERVHGFENHVGLFMARAEEGALTRLADRLETTGRMVYEGSAHNPHENTTMLYFAPSAPVARTRRRFPRWELQCAGDLAALTAERQIRTHALLRAYAALKANHVDRHDDRPFDHHIDAGLTQSAPARPRVPVSVREG